MTDNELRTVVSSLRMKEVMLQELINDTQISLSEIRELQNKLKKCIGLKVTFGKNKDE